MSADTHPAFKDLRGTPYMGERIRTRTDAQVRLALHMDEHAHRAGYKAFEEAPVAKRLAFAMRALDSVGRSGDVSFRDSDGAYRFTLATRKELAEMIRQRAVTGAVPRLQRPGDVVLDPTAGAVAGLLRVFPATSESVVVVSEGTRTEVAGITPFGTALTESSVSFTKADEQSRRFGSWIPILKSTATDAGVAQDVVETLLRRDTFRSIDHQVLNGNNTGSGDGKQFDGLAVATSITEIALGADSRGDALMKAVTAIRNDDHVGPIRAVINPADMEQLTLEKDASGAYVFGELLAALRERGFEGFTESSLCPAGKVLVADWKQAATLYPRSDVTVSVTDSHASFFIEGKWAIGVEARLAMKLRLPSAIRRITGF